ncbi:nuclear transport factor 2 family protein [Acidicapsa dinghuensis]|uniref:Nuclear transport factor 2 family protein n=1 Tax=Acidicapsa dinghuensis TaxID=2218256 RepID=A0ABW1EJ64_9BACT|nr:nuclear transport factor 2 family protein [Acidicapsa dinghuensis]
MPRLERTLPKLSIPVSILSAAVMLFWLWTANAKVVRAEGSNTVEPHTEAAVIADDKRWDKAEESGDTAFIDALLLPEYRSISSDGSTHDKAAIIANARRNVNSPERAAAIEKWRTAHPQLINVKITGDTAILTFSLDKPAVPKPVMSCDVFVYRDGRWRALYSQHTEAGK